ncbi:hypothetical protein FUAX_44430 (plasmid) [Fulvitalea axinellae]|uniref:Secretion system C-terminal sorting domain-containing protein n=1 Tax=Fulvitalea axinellae TaxID=1182444 RepID=A0AAU9DFU8_9BACT|nr:hypothetical protein FUAX_44430 [Fulvitalea axinellae]
MRAPLIPLLLLLCVWQAHGQQWKKVSVLELEGKVELGYEDNIKNPAMDISGNTAVIADNSDDVVNVFEKKDGRWTKVAALRVSEKDASFGYNVTLSNNVVLVSGWQNNQGAGYRTGVVYLFEKPDNGWKDMTETAVLYASDGAFQDNFGIDKLEEENEEGAFRLRQMAIEEGLIVVKALGNDDSCWDCGGAYIFEKPEGGWVTMPETGKLLLSPQGLLSGGRMDDYAECAVKDGTVFILERKKVFIFEKPDSGWKPINLESGMVPIDFWNQRIHAVSKDEILLPVTNDSNPVSLLSIKKGESWNDPKIRKIIGPSGYNFISKQSFDGNGNSVYMLGLKDPSWNIIKVSIDNDGATWQTGNVSFKSNAVSSPAYGFWLNTLEATDNDILYSVEFPEYQKTSVKPIFYSTEGDSWLEIPSDFEEVTREEQKKIEAYSVISESEVLVKSNDTEKDTYNLYRYEDGEWKNAGGSFKSEGYKTKVYGDYFFMGTDKAVLHQNEDDSPSSDWIKIGTLYSRNEIGVAKSLLFPIKDDFTQLIGFINVDGVFLNNQIILTSDVAFSGGQYGSLALVADLDIETGELSVVDYKLINDGWKTSKGNSVITDGLCVVPFYDDSECCETQQLKAFGYKKNESGKIYELVLEGEFPVTYWGWEDYVVADGDFIVHSTLFGIEITVAHRKDGKWSVLPVELVRNPDYWIKGGQTFGEVQSIDLIENSLFVLNPFAGHILIFDLEKALNEYESPKKLEAEFVKLEPEDGFIEKVEALDQDNFLINSRGKLSLYTKLEKDVINFEDQVITLIDDLTLGASAISGSLVKYEYEAGKDIIDFRNGDPTLLGTGRMLVRAYTDGGNERASAEAFAFLTVTKASQTITVEALTENVIMPNESYALSFSSDSGLPVLAEIIEGQGELTGGILRPTQAGVLRIRFSQEGDDSYFPASPVERTYQVTKVTGIDGQAIVKVFPNPSNGELNIEANDNGKAIRVLLVSLEGKKLIEKRIDTKEKKTKIQISEPGIYIMKIRSGKKSEERRILIR